MATLWSGRFEMPPDADILEFGASFSFDRRLFEDDVIGSLAWVEALGEAEVLPPAEVQAIQAALQDILDAGRRDQAFVQGGDEDVHSFVERQVIERIGEV